MNGFRAFVPWCSFVGATALLGGAFVVQERDNIALRAERDQLTVAMAAAPVAVEPVNATPPASTAPIAASVESASDEFNRAAIQRLQTEINQLRERVTTRERALREFNAARAVSRHRKALITEETLPYENWANAGRATPEATIETALWAGAGGDVGAFDELLTFDDDAAIAARTLFNRLPADIQAEHGRAERIVALFTAGDVPLTAARLLGSFEIASDQRVVIVQLHDPAPGPEHPPRLINFRARADASDGTWRIVVPRSAIDTYARRLAGTPTAP